MLFYTGLLFLVIAVSLDGFGVGITYGIRKIHIPLLGLFIIMLCSGFIVLLSMSIGNVLNAFISPHFAKVIGGIILISLGLFSFIQVKRAKINPVQKTEQKKTTRKVLVLKVLSKPTKADLDQSGNISASEALLLGTALALDAFGAGLGASIIGYPPLLTSLLIASMSGLFVFSGIQTGFYLSKIKTIKHMTYIPSILLILLGLYNIF